MMVIISESRGACSEQLLANTLSLVMGHDIDNISLPGAMKMSFANRATYRAANDDACVFSYEGMTTLLDKPPRISLGTTFSSDDIQIGV